MQFSDTITNSSTEVFLIKSSKELKKVLSHLRGIECTIFNTDKDIFTYLCTHTVEDNEAFAKELPYYYSTPFNLLDIEGFSKFINHTPEEVWEFMKAPFLKFIGYTLITLDNHYIETENNIQELIKLPDYKRWHV